MHGGALRSGAPRGNKNALKHGRYTREANCGTRAHSRTGTAGAQAAPTDRVTCLADQQGSDREPRNPAAETKARGFRTNGIQRVIQPH